ncbi:MAG: P-loop NTPase fold protein [Pseudomonadota bacterium]
MAGKHFTDAPIKSRDEDELGHFLIAERLAEAILDSKNSGANVLAVTGKWGAGKSGILDLLKQYLDEIPVPDKKSARYRPSTIQFRPWLVGSKSGLIASFFAQLNQVASDIRNSNLAPMEIDSQRWKKATKKLQKTLAKFGETATSAATIAAPADASGFMALFAAGGHAVTQTLKNILEGDSSLEKERTAVIEALQSVAKLQNGFRIVVFVDDLDRLEPHEAVEVLRLVKAVADFPYITYVLAYDELVLARATQLGMHVDNGSDYLQKIVQFSIAVPKPSSNALALWFQRLIQSEFAKAADYTSRRSYLILSYWAGRLLQTPRDVKRLIISLKMMWPSLENKADFLDLVWVELLRLKANSGEQNLYDWVFEYVEAVAKRQDGGRPITPEASAQRLQQILLNLGWNYKENGDSAIDPHYLDELLPGISLSWFSEEVDFDVFNFRDGVGVTQFIAEKRLGSPRHWSFYSALDKPRSAISDLDVNVLFGQADRVGLEPFEESVFGLLESAKSFSDTPADQLILERLEPSVRLLSKGALISWLALLMRHPKQLLKYSRVSGSSDPWNDFFKDALSRVSIGLIKRLEDGSRLTEIERILRKNASPWAVANLLHAIQLARKADPILTESELMSSSAWDRLVDTASTFFNEMSVDDFELSVDPWPTERSTDAWRIFSTWRDLGDEQDASNWLNAYLSDDDLLCDRLHYLVSYSYSNEAMPHLVQKNFDGLIDVGKLVDRLQMQLLLGNEKAVKAGFLISIMRS